MFIRMNYIEILRTCMIYISGGTVAHYWLSITWLGNLTVKNEFTINHLENDIKDINMKIKDIDKHVKEIDKYLR